MLVLCTPGGWVVHETLFVLLPHNHWLLAASLQHCACRTLLLLLLPLQVPVAPGSGILDRPPALPDTKDTDVAK